MGVGVGMSVLGREQQKQRLVGGGGVNLACALRFPYSWSPGGREGKWMKVNQRGEGQMVKGL